VVFVNQNPSYDSFFDSSENGGLAISDLQKRGTGPATHFPGPLDTGFYLLEFVAGTATPLA